MKVKILNISYILGHQLEPYIGIWQIILNFGQIIAIENLFFNLILALLICNFSFELYIASKKGS
jgi:hypothetical protein